jgi:large subunit ribosomal protein L3
MFRTMSADGTAIINSLIKALMNAGILGKKIGMMQMITDNGIIVPVTAVKIPDQEVLQVKTKEKENTNAIVLGMDAYKKPSKNKKFKTIREFKVQDITQYTKGQQLTIDVLKDITTTTVSSISKGKGFQGVIKRFGFHGGPGSHGSHFHREPGSIGQRQKPGKVQKGKKLPGHMGVDRLTFKKRPLIKVNGEEKIIYIKGSIPGSRNTLIEIQY